MICIIYISIYIVVLWSIPRNMMVSGALLDASLSSYTNFFIVLEKTLINKSELSCECLKRTVNLKTSSLMRKWKVIETM